MWARGYGPRHAFCQQHAKRLRTKFGLVASHEPDLKIKGADEMVHWMNAELTVERGEDYGSVVLADGVIIGVPIPRRVAEKVCSWLSAGMKDLINHLQARLESERAPEEKSE